MAENGLDPQAHYFHIEGDGAEVIEVTDAFWPEVMAGKRRLEGWLVAGCRFRGNPPHAEMHPRGDEILVLMEGRLDVLLEGRGEGGGDRVIALRPGQACLVPRGTWHWQVVHEESTLLALTCGKGTEHKPVPA